MRIRKRDRFTLTEMLIVLAIIVLIVGVVGVNMASAVRKERFRTGSDLVVSKLQLAQDLMLVLKTDVVVKFEQNPEGLSCTVVLERPINSIQKHHTIPGIASIAFEDQDQHVVTRAFDVEFLSGGTKMSKGTVHLYSKENRTGMEKSIVLPGHPTTLSKEKRQDYKVESYETLYPKDIQKILLEEKSVSSS